MGSELTLNTPSRPMTEKDFSRKESEPIFKPKNKLQRIQVSSMTKQESPAKEVPQYL